MRRAAFLLSAVLFVSLGCAARPNRSAPPPPAIEAITGCPLDADNATLVCTPPFTLTIAGSDIDTATAVLNISNTLVLPTLPPPVVVSASGLDAAAFTLGLDYRPLPYQSLAHVSLLDVNTRLQSAVSTIRVLPYPPVALHSISGCSGSGPSTSACNLQTSVLTISGSGFVVDGQWWTMWFTLFSPARFAASPLLTATGGWSINDSSTITVQMSYILGRMYIKPDTANMTLCFSHGGALSNCLALSYFYQPDGTQPPDDLPIAGVAVTNDIVITSVTGCPIVYANGSTAGCVGANTFTLTGNGFPVQSFSILIRIGGANCEGGAVSETTIACSVSGSLGSAAQYDTWLPVVVMDGPRQQQSATFLGVMFSTPAPVVLSSVSGCAGDGLSGDALHTSLCLYSTDVLTIRGSGFSSPRASWLAVMTVLGSLSLQQVDVTANVVDSRSIVIPLSTLFQPLLASIVKPNSTATLCLSNTYSQLSTGCASIDWLSPLPVIIGLTGCNSSELSSAVSECLPGVSTLSVAGSYFPSSISVTAGGEQCAIVSQSQSGVECIAPVLPGLVANVGYELVLYSDIADSISLPAAVSYTAHPAIVSVTSQYCPADYLYEAGSGPIALRCDVGDILTIVGSYFADLSTLAVQIDGMAPAYGPWGGGYPQFTGLCDSLTFLSTTELTCVLPAFSQWGDSAATYFQVQVIENATYSSNAVDAVLYHRPGQPHIVSVAGCAQSNATTRGVAGCRAGDNITLTGSGFVAGAPGTLQVQLYHNGDIFHCASPRVVSRTTLTCRLPLIASPPLLDTVAPIRVVKLGGSTSNWLVAVSYEPSPLPANADCSSATDSRYIVVLSVTVPVIVALLLVVARLVTLLRADKSGSLWQRHADDSSHSGGLQMSAVDASQ